MKDFDFFLFFVFSLIVLIKRKAECFFRFGWAHGKIQESVSEFFCSREGLFCFAPRCCS